MEIKIDEQALKESGKSFEEVAYMVENMQWRSSLPGYEQYMIADVVHEFKLKRSGFSDEEYKRYSNISYHYSRIESFYDVEAETIRKELSHGVKRSDIPYDVSLTKEQAYEKYCECDRETARKINKLITRIDKEATYFEKDIKDKYTGDLSEQLGIDKEKYLKQEEEFKAKAKEFATKLKQIMDRPDIQEQMNQVGESIGKYGEFVEKTTEEYKKRH